MQTVAVMEYEQGIQVSMTSSGFQSLFCRPIVFPVAEAFAEDCRCEQPGGIRPSSKIDKTNYLIGRQTAIADFITLRGEY